MNINLLHQEKLKLFAICQSVFGLQNSGITRISAEFLGMASLSLFIYNFCGLYRNSLPLLSK